MKLEGKDYVELKQYIKRRRGGRDVHAGVMLAVKTCDNVHIAWSKCKLKADKFDKDLGTEIARGRLRGTLEDGRKFHAVPNSIRDDMAKFFDRCMVYYKVEPECIVIV